MKGSYKRLKQTLKEVTKYPKGQEKVKKPHKTYMKKLKEDILRENQLPISSSTCNSTTSTGSSTSSTSSSGTITSMALV